MKGASSERETAMDGNNDACSYFLANHGQKFFLGGEWKSPKTSEILQIVSPITEEIIGTVPAAGKDDIDVAVAAARQAFDGGPWPRMSAQSRSAYLTNIASHLRTRSVDFGHCWTAQVGVVFTLSRRVGAIAADIFEYYAGKAESFKWEEKHERASPRRAGVLVREPVGVVAAILPWNAPLISAAVKIAPALLAGCTIVLKLPPQCPLDGVLLAEIAEEVGLPPGVLNVVTADWEASEHLVQNRQVDKVSFTGSVEVGRRIASLMGDRIGRVSLELGGKSPAIVLDDYPLEDVATLMAFGNACQAAGQACASLTRVLISDRRQEALLEALKAEYLKVAVGNPYEPSTDMGPLAMERQLLRVQRYIEKGKQEGASLITGGIRPSHLERGFYIAPTVFGGVSNEMAIAREEIFGPVTSVIPYRSLDHAMQIANDTIFGLGGCVFTHDDQAAYQIARLMRTGTVSQSGFDSDFSIAFGGFKQSGIGREGGEEGLMEFLETKTLLLSSFPPHLKV
jgi:acyl-CoA reductase-like NAD-dependent aldehyde dehydrogenase